MRRNHGFTLIELMVTVVLVGILASVAYPSYLTYVSKTHRAAAAAFLLEVSSRQQRYLLDARSYAADMAALGMMAPPEIARHYTITTSPKPDAKPPGFIATAQPVGDQATRDSDCGALTIDETGEKKASGPRGQAACW